MVDNMVHIGHNCVIGKNACIAAQTGISDSYHRSKCNYWYKRVFWPYLIGDNVIIAAKSGVTKNIKDNSVVAGFPAIDIKKNGKNSIRQKKMDIIIFKKFYPMVPFINR